MSNTSPPVLGDGEDIPILTEAEAAKPTSHFVQAKKAVEVLSVCRKTLNRWARQGRIAVRRAGPRGRFLYDVGRFLKHDDRSAASDESPRDFEGESAVERAEDGEGATVPSAAASAPSSQIIRARKEVEIPENVIYLRTSAKKFRALVEGEAERLRRLHPGAAVLSDTSTSANYDQRPEMYALLDACVQGRVKRLIIPSEDVFGRHTFPLVRWLLHKHDVTIIIEPPMRRIPMDEDDAPLNEPPEGEGAGEARSGSRSAFEPPAGGSDSLRQRRRQRIVLAPPPKAASLPPPPPPLPPSDGGSPDSAQRLAAMLVHVTASAEGLPQDKTREAEVAMLMELDGGEEPVGLPFSPDPGTTRMSHAPSADEISRAAAAAHLSASMSRFTPATFVDSWAGSPLPPRPTRAARGTFQLKRARPGTESGLGGGGEGEKRPRLE